MVTNTIHTDVRRYLHTFITSYVTAFLDGKSILPFRPARQKSWAKRTLTRLWRSAKWRCLCPTGLRWTWRPACWPFTSARTRATAYQPGSPPGQPDKAFFETFHGARTWSFGPTEFKLLCPLGSLERICMQCNCNLPVSDSIRFEWGFRSLLDDLVVLSYLFVQTSLFLG